MRKSGTFSCFFYFLPQGRLAPDLLHAVKHSTSAQPDAIVPCKRISWALSACYFCLHVRCVVEHNCLLRRTELLVDTLLMQIQVPLACITNCTKRYLYFSLDLYHATLHICSTTAKRCKVHGAHSRNPLQQIRTVFPVDPLRAYFMHYHT